MGVKFREIIVHLAHNCIEPKTLNDYYGLTIAVDTFIFIYKAVLDYRRFNAGIDKVNIRGEIVTHLEYIFDKILKLNKYNITSLWIFDGKQPEIKKDELKRRRREKARLQKEYEESPEFNPDKPIHAKNFTINGTILSNLYRMLRLMGIQYVKAKGESDDLGSKLNKNKIVDGIITEDWDALPFGCDNLIKGFGSRDGLYSVNKEKLLESLKLTEEELVDFCILLGTDYCPSIEGLSGLSAYHMYYEFKDIRKMIDHLHFLNKINQKTKYVIPDNFIEKWTTAKEYYLNEIKEENLPNRIIWNKPQRNKLIEFLCNECGFDRRKSISRIDKLMDQYNRYTNNKKRVINNVCTWKSNTIKLPITILEPPNEIVNCENEKNYECKQNYKQDYVSKHTQNQVFKPGWMDKRWQARNEIFICSSL